MMTPSDLIIPVLISVGAIGGALARYSLTLLCIQRLGAAFPFGTLLVNLVGCLLIGFFATLIQAQVIATAVYPLIVTGFLGGFTTFSTYVLDISNLLQTKRYHASLVYGLGSTSLGLLCVACGIWIAQQWLIK